MAEWKKFHRTWTDYLKELTEGLENVGFVKVSDHTWQFNPKNSRFSLFWCFASPNEIQVFGLDREGRIINDKMPFDARWYGVDPYVE